MYLTKRMIFEEIKNAINESFGVNKNIVAIINDLMEDINEFGTKKLVYIIPSPVYDGDSITVRFLSNQVFDENGLSDGPGYSDFYKRTINIKFSLLQKNLTNKIKTILMHELTHFVQMDSERSDLRAKRFAYSKNKNYLGIGKEPLPGMEDMTYGDFGYWFDDSEIYAYVAQAYYDILGVMKTKDVETLSQKEFGNNFLTNVMYDIEASMNDLFYYVEDIAPEEKNGPILINIGISLSNKTQKKALWVKELYDKAGYENQRLYIQQLAILKKMILKTMDMKMDIVYSKAARIWKRLLKDRINGKL